MLHELGHYARFHEAAQKLTLNPEIEASITVYRYVDPERGLSFAIQPEVYPPDYITRRDLALALLAPNDGPSLYDLAYAQSLGCPTDVQQAVRELEQGRDPEAEAVHIKAQELEYGIWAVLRQ
jgi:hypothetical protein